MATKSMYGLHKDQAGQVLAAASHTHNFQRGDWLKSLDIRPGDTVEFHEVAERTDDEPFTPAFIETQAPPPTPEAVLAETDDQPF